MILANCIDLSRMLLLGLTGAGSRRQVMSTSREKSFLEGEGGEVPSV